MNFLAPYSWLADYCKTRLTPQELAARISLSGPSVERLLNEEDEWIFDIETTTNRYDMFSMAGLAREIGAITDTPFKDPFKKKAQESQSAKKGKFSHALGIRIKDSNACRRYAGVVLDHVKVGQSPDWMQKRLLLCGQRPINNVVDITNYVMLEYGQPMHAFDADLVGDVNDSNKEIIVRRAVDGEPFETLDGDCKTLTSQMLVIADTAGPLAIAGIKGGKRAGISESTHTIVLESANFDPVSVRSTSRALDLRTDSSARYEKNISSGVVPFALERAIELLGAHASARVCSPRADEFKKVPKARPFVFPLSLYERIVGLPIDEKKAKASLTRLGFHVEASKKAYRIEVPFWREADIEESVDFVEEIARMDGYTNVPIETIRGSIPSAPRDALFAWEKETKHLLKDIGWTEVMNYSLVSEQLLKKADVSLGACILVSNPLSREFEYLRPSLLPGLVAVLAENEQRAEDVAVFEMSRVYHPKGADQLPDEPTMLLGAFMKKGKPQDLFREAKGTIEVLMRAWFPARQSEYIAKPLGKNRHSWHAGSSAELFLGSKPIGVVGALLPEIVSRFGIKTPCVFFEMNMTELVALFDPSIVYRPIPKYPSVVRDIAFVIDKKFQFADIVSHLKRIDSLIGEVELFDLFDDEKRLGKGKQSLAFHITYQSGEKTLQTAQVDTVHQKVIETLKNRFAIETR